MTVLEVLAILEAGVLDCKHRQHRHTGHERRVDLLGAAHPASVAIPQYRDHALDHDQREGRALEGQQQVLRATFPIIRESVRELLGQAHG
jgi:hypothetical protein